MNKIISVLLMVLLSIAAVSAAPVTIQDGNLNISKNLTIQGNEVDSIHIKTASGSSIFRIDALNDLAYTGNQRPRSDANYDLGQSSVRYKNAYFSGNVTASNLCLSNGTNCVSSQDTNETTRFNALVNTDCSGTDKVIGMYENGTVVCGSDLNSGSQKQADGFYLTNDSMTIYFNETKLNQTIDLRDDDTIYSNGTGLSLSGNTFSVILSYFQGLFVELTDSFGGDVSGTYDNLQVTDNSHTLDWNNVTNKPNLDTNSSDDLNASTPFAGDVSGTYNTLQVADDSHSLHWDNVSNKPANLDTDSTDDVTTSTSYDGDVSGTYNALQVADNSHSLNWDNVTNKPNLDTNSSDDLNASTTFGGDVSGTYDNLQLGADVVGDNELNTSQVTINDLTNDAGYLANNSNAVFNSVKSQDWSNITITESQLNNYAANDTGDIHSAVSDLHLVNGTTNINTSQFEQGTGNVLNIQWSWLSTEFATINSVNSQNSSQFNDYNARIDNQSSYLRAVNQTIHTPDKDCTSSAEYLSGIGTCVTTEDWDTDVTDDVTEQTIVTNIVQPNNATVKAEIDSQNSSVSLFCSDRIFLTNETQNAYWTQQNTSQFNDYNVRIDNQSSYLRAVNQTIHTPDTECSTASQFLSGINTCVDTSAWDQDSSDDFDGSYFNTTSISGQVGGVYGVVDTYVRNAAVSDVAYASSWNAATTIAPSKNAVYDKIETLAPVITSKISAGRSTTQSLTNAVDTVVIFNSEFFDGLGEYNNNTGLFTAQEAGYYLVTWSVLMNQVEWTSGELFRTYLSKNGLATAGNAWEGTRSDAWATLTDFRQSQGTAIVYLGASDNLKVYANQQTGASLNINAGERYTYFQIHRLS